MANGKMFSFVSHYYPEPLYVDKARDCFVYNEAGEEFLDAYAAVASISVGHAHPRVCKAVSEQIERVNQTTMLYRTRVLDNYISELQKHLPKHLNRHFFVNSGSEAIDFACQASRAHRGRSKILALSDGYHGGSFLAKSITGIPAWQPVHGKDAHVAFFHTPGCSTCDEVKRPGVSKRLSILGSDCRGNCLGLLEDELNKNADEVASVILEPVLGVGGILIPSRGFFQRLQATCEKHGIDLIVDEVQSGFGRCGSRLFGFQLLGLSPDIVCMGKGMANGFPMGLVSARSQISDAMGNKLHFSTFGGNPMSCAAALETLRIIDEEQLVRQVEQVGEYFMAHLDAALLDQPLCKEIRGVGLIIGLEIENAQAAGKILQKCYEKNLLIGLGGRNRNVIRIEPPLTFTPEMADKATGIIQEAMQEITAESNCQ